MIWNKDELKVIYKIISSKDVNIAYENDKIVLKRKANISYIKNSNSIFNNDLLDSFDFLLANANKEEIDNILTKYSSVEFDINNKLHYGLISSLSKIDLNKNNSYYTQIFIIFKELVGQYERVIASVIDESFSNINDINVIQEKINNIKQGGSNEEKQVNFLMQKTFAQTNGLDNEEIFKNIINNCNNKIKERLLSKAYFILGRVAKNNEVNKLRKYGTRSLNYS